MRYKIAVAILLISLVQLAVSSSAAPQKRTAPSKSGPSSAALGQAMGAYLNRLRPKLMNNWMVPDGNNTVTLIVTVEPDGSASEVQMSSKPKNEPAETAAASAFSKAQPLEALPSGVPQSKLTLSFISNADPHGDSSSNILTRLDPIAKKPQSAPQTTQK
ncbi:MAG TPA: TonB C-terminal domain-containing protein [Planktothrix sp.]|jgi:hypothetical protein